MPKKKTKKRKSAKKTSTKKLVSVASKKRLSKKVSAKKSSVKKAVSKKTQSNITTSLDAKKKSVSAKKSATKSSRKASIKKAATTRTVEINDHEALASLGTQINRVLNADPRLAAMLFVNPVLAMQEAGVKLSRPMVHHILSRLRHPPAMRERREYLEKTLREALGGTPQPNNSAWLARALFKKLKLQALDTDGLSPSYHPLRDAQAQQRLQSLRPKRTHRYTELPRRHKPGQLQVRERAPTLRRMDLNAKLPALKPDKHVPKRVSLEMLYFYKDSNPVARDLLELAIIQRRGLRLHSRHSYRLIKEGKRGNVFHRWFRRVSFPEGKA
jgi:hypothetical protein